MFSNVQILDAKVHQALCFTPATDFGFARALWQAPLALAEIMPAALCFPVLFTHDTPLTAIALMGKEHNLFVDAKNRWTAGYLPVHVQRYPFAFGRVKNAEDFLLMADLDAPQFKTSAGTKVFGADGALNPTMQPVVKLLLEFEAGRQQSLLQQLVEKDMLLDRALYKKVGEQSILLGQYRVVDHEKLATLDDATLADWTRSGLMKIIDAHLLSMRHLGAMLNA
jgi:putative transposase